MLIDDLGRTYLQELQSDGANYKDLTSLPVYLLLNSERHYARADAT